VVGDTKRRERGEVHGGSQQVEVGVDLCAAANARALVQDPNWGLYTNFHFGHMEGGYAWCATTIDVERYIEIWQAKIGDTGAVNRDDWDQYWDWLLREGIASPGDRVEFDRHFTATQRQTATPRPGLKLIRSWDRNEADALDGQHLLSARPRGVRGRRSSGLPPRRGRRA
jgi:hypothetical protein